MQRYTTDEPKLLTATISKNRAAALKLERGEQEVIVFSYPDESSIHWDSGAASWGEILTTVIEGWPPRWGIECQGL